MIIDITNGDAANVAYWKAERLLVKWTTSNDITFAYVEGGDYPEVATYKAADGVVLIDITDFVRTYPTRTALLFADLDASIQRGVIIKHMGLINPAGVYIPFHPLSQKGLLVAPPSKMYDGFGYGVGLFLYPREDNSVSGDADYNSATGEIYNIDGAFSITRDGVSHTYSLMPLSCDREYAAVRWRSFDGSMRVHTWEMRKNTIAADGGFSLLDLNNEYRDIKGREDGMTLSMRGLNAYDYWYYSDLITSPLVEVSLDTINWTKVEVTSKNVTIPDGDSFDGKIDITIKYKRYDAVDM